MKNKKISRPELHLVTLLILEYRISLDEICKTFKYDPEKLYNALMYFNNEKIQTALRYALDDETHNVSEESKKESKKNLRRFLSKFSTIKNRDEKIELINSLNHDKDVYELRNIERSRLTDEQMLEISKYRLKYALSRFEIERNFKISFSELKNFERNKIEDPILSERLMLLGNTKNRIYNKKR